jgi:predicted PhzF superfamily epimerase YddE/YHI9
MDLHVLRVFIGPDGRAGNHLGVFVDGSRIAAERRQTIAADLGFAETVFVDEVAAGSARIAIFTPAVELPFAGHPTVGTSWLLGHVGSPITTLIVAAGKVVTWQDGALTWIRAQPAWSPTFDFVELGSAAEVDAEEPPALGSPNRYVWAWVDEPAGHLRARSFPSGVGIREDEATGSAAVVLGARFGRPVRIRQGAGSEIQARPGPGGTGEAGGRTVIDEVRPFA